MIYPQPLLTTSDDVFSLLAEGSHTLKGSLLSLDKAFRNMNGKGERVLREIKALLVGDERGQS